MLSLDSLQVKFSATFETFVMLNLKLNSKLGTTPMHSRYARSGYLLSHPPRYNVDHAYFNLHMVTAQYTG